MGGNSKERTQKRRRRGNSRGGTQKSLQEFSRPRRTCQEDAQNLFHRPKKHLYNPPCPQVCTAPPPAAANARPPPPPRFHVLQLTRNDRTKQGWRVRAGEPFPFGSHKEYTLLANNPEGTVQAGIQANRKKIFELENAVYACCIFQSSLSLVSPQTYPLINMRHVAACTIEARPTSPAPWCWRTRP